MFSNMHYSFFSWKKRKTKSYYYYSVLVTSFFLIKCYLSSLTLYMHLHWWWVIDGKEQIQISCRTVSLITEFFSLPPLLLFWKLYLNQHYQWLVQLMVSMVWTILVICFSNLSLNYGLLPFFTLQIMLVFISLVV